jgi:hypothetical protein
MSCWQPRRGASGGGHRSVIERVDLLLAHDWPYDAPFLELLKARFADRGLRLRCVGPQELLPVLAALDAGQLTSRAFLDRASDTSPEFLPLVEWAGHAQVHVLNPVARQRIVWRKTNLHWEFLRAGMFVPYLIPVPSLERQAVIPVPHDLGALGSPFCVKPDVGGGGWGVRIDAATWSDVEAARRQMPEEDLILQQLITPAILEGRRAWFRVLHACGRALPCWWDDQTRCFDRPVSEEERLRHGLDDLWRISRQAAEISGLRLFSTEIACDTDGRFVVVDYVNDPVDLRFQPHAREGMPASVARQIADTLTEHVERLAAGSLPSEGALVAERG